MTLHWCYRGVGAVASMCLLIAIGGCGPKVPVSRNDERVDESPAPVVIGRVNANAAAMNFLLRAGGVEAKGEYQRGEQRETFDLNGVMLYRRPRDLYLKLDHLGPAVEAGSNDREFWFWEKIGDQRYSWGEHALMTDQFESDIPLRPDLLADVLGLGGLPDVTESKDLLMWKETDRYELIFQSHDAQGRAYITKRVDIDRFAPYLVRTITYLRRDGQPVMQADLSDYKVVQGSTVQVPTHIRIDWLYDRGWADMTFSKVERFDQPKALERFVSPRERGILGDSVEVRLDHPHVPLPPVSDQPKSEPAPESTIDINPAESQ